MNSVCISFVGGCPRSKVDTTLLFEYFSVNGWRVTNNFREADLVLVGGCAFSNFAEDRTLRFLSIILKKRRPNVPVMMVGCIAGISGEEIAAKYDITPITQSNLSKFDQIIGAKIPIAKVKEGNCVEECIEYASSGFTMLEQLSAKSLICKQFLMKALLRAYTANGHQDLLSSADRVFTIRLARGCLEECSYCAIRLASGSLRSKPFQKVQEEFATGLSSGHSTFSLVAEDVGAYGQDIGTNIGVLLRSLLLNKNEYSIRWSDFHPRWLVQHLSEVVDALRLNPGRIASMGFPVQSGSQKVLDAMKRNYDIHEVERCLITLREICPDACLSTHILVGFPGETEEDFEETRRFVRAVGFDKVDVYDYSERPNTVGIHLDNKVPQPTKYTRLFRFCHEFRTVAVSY